MTSRRTFLVSLLTGIGTLTMLPFVALAKPKSRDYVVCHGEPLTPTPMYEGSTNVDAIHFLTQAWNHYSRRIHQSRRGEIQMYAGKALFEKFESEITALNRRKNWPVWTSDAVPFGLRFKGSYLRSNGLGWQLRIETEECRPVFYKYSWSKKDIIVVS